MKKFSLLIFLFLVSMCFSGCRKVCYCHFQGKCEVIQPDCIVKINKLGPGYDFILTVVGKDEKASLSIDSIQGSYKYETNTVQPLRLIFSRDNRAAFVPDDALMKTKYQGVVQSILMKDGHYIFNFDYVLNKQTNSCNFDVHLVTGTRIDFTSWIYKLEMLFYGLGSGG